MYPKVVLFTVWSILACNYQVDARVSRPFSTNNPVPPVQTRVVQGTRRADCSDLIRQELEVLYHQQGREPEAVSPLSNAEKVSTREKMRDMIFMDSFAQNVRYTYSPRSNTNINANHASFTSKPIVLVVHIPQTESVAEIEMNGLDMVLKYTDQSEIADDVYAIPPPNGYTNRDTSAVTLDCYLNAETGKTNCNVHCLVFGLDQ